MADLQCDVLVVGGGVTGVAAATAAARAGARTMLLESRPFVGGNATTGLCLHNYLTKFRRQVVFGLAQEMVDRLVAMGGAVGHIPYEGFVSAVTPVDGNYFRIMATEMLAEAGVQILYGVNMIGVETAGRRVTAVQAAMKGGVRSIGARAVIDASGDADVAAFAGAAFRKGQAQTGKMQPVSMILHFHGVDTVRIAREMADCAPAMATRPDHPTPFPVYFNGTFEKWDDLVIAEGLFPNRGRNVFFNTCWPDQLNVNTSAVIDIDGTDPLALSRATVELTQQCARIAGFLKKHVPGFAGGYYVPAAVPGVRETRNIVGRYMITDEDVRTGRKFDDTVGQICFPVDIHSPDSGQAIFDPIGDDGAFDIPYRAMLPQEIDNVVVAGRCVSATHYAHGATRNMAPCLVMGEAAGVAGALAVAHATDAALLEPSMLQRKLLAGGVFLGDRHARVA